MPDPSPLVGLAMGSESDWPTMEAAADVLHEFGVPFEARVLSAHRTPDAMAEYAETAAARGLKVIVAGAGGAAHLPGMIAASTVLPVIGVPVALLALWLVFKFAKRIVRFVFTLALLGLLAC